MEPQEPGSGACGMVEGMEVLIGNEEWLQTHGVQVPEALTSNVPAHNTTIHVGIGGQYAGTLSLRDEVRGCSAHVVQTLRKMGLKPKMLSGENHMAAPDLLFQVLTCRMPS